MLIEPWFKPLILRTSLDSVIMVAEVLALPLAFGVAFYVGAAAFDRFNSWRNRRGHPRR